MAGIRVVPLDGEEYRVNRSTLFASSVALTRGRCRRPWGCRCAGPGEQGRQMRAACDEGHVGAGGRQASAEVAAEAAAPEDGNSHNARMHAMHGTGSIVPVGPSRGCFRPA